MNAKDDLLQARAAMMEALDVKLANVPEWRALRAIDKLLSGGDAPSASNGAKHPRPRIARGKRPYGELALDAINAAGLPVTTSALVEFIGERRKLGKDPRKARINIQSGLSRDKHVHSVPWRGGRAWWHKDRAVPKEESAGSSSNP